MSGQQQYNDFDSDLRFDANPNYGAQGGQPAFENFSNQASLQPAWASPAPQQQPVYNQGFEQQPYGGSNYAQFDNSDGMQQPPPPPPQQPPAGDGHHHHDTTAQPRHPIAAFFHVAFKAAAILCYFFIGIGSTSSTYVTNVIAVLCLTAADFWTTKNVTGRLLVGLRWWNDVKEDGTNEWVFESLEGQRLVHQSEALLFWGALLANCIFWFAFGIVNLISLSLLNFQECLVVFILSAANLIGYFKCARDASNRVKALATSFVVNQAVGYVAGQNNNNNPSK